MKLKEILPLMNIYERDLYGTDDGKIVIHPNNREMVMQRYGDRTVKQITNVCRINAGIQLADKD